MPAVMPGDSPTFWLTVWADNNYDVSKAFDASTDLFL